MSSTYEIHGLPLVAVRLGSALQGWGTRAARPLTHDELRERQRELREVQVARDARDAALYGLSACFSRGRAVSQSATARSTESSRGL